MPRRPRKTARIFKKRCNVGKPKPRNESEPTNSNIRRPRPTQNDTFHEVESASKNKLGDIDNNYSVYSDEENVNIVVDLNILMNN